MRYRMDLAYSGAGFFGWQLQPGVPTVQEALEKALTTLLREPVRVTGAGRTDTGVNASRYTAHFDTSRILSCGAEVSGGAEESCAQLRYKLNAILPKAVCIIEISPASDDFHARFGATLRQYTYYLHRTKDPFLDDRSWFCAYPGLDFEAMNRAAACLEGTFDFSCFEKSGGDNKTSVCTVRRAFWEQYTPAPAAYSGPAAEGIYWRFTIEADRFLRNMVRAVVGTLIEVGRHRRSVEEFQSLLLPPALAECTPSKGPSRRSEAGESVPGHALFLSGISY